MRRIVSTENVAIKMRSSLLAQLLFLLTLSGAAACRDVPQSPAPPPPPELQNSFDERPPRLNGNFLQRESRMLVIRNENAYPWTMFDQIRIWIATPNAPSIREVRTPDQA